MSVLKQLGFGEVEYRSVQADIGIIHPAVAALSDSAAHFPLIGHPDIFFSNTKCLDSLDGIFHHYGRAYDNTACIPDIGKINFGNEFRNQADITEGVFISTVYGQDDFGIPSPPLNILLKQNV